MDLGPLLRPRSVAVVGASPRTFVGQIALRNAAQLGFAGRVVPVNPRYDKVAGVPTAASIAALDEPPDLVLAQIATGRVLSVVEQAVTAGVRAFVVPGGGHTDSGDLATELSAGLARLGARRCVVGAGPNCMGVVDLVTGAAPYIGTVPASVRRGSVAVVAQSGAVVEAFLNAGGRVPFSTLVSSGSEAVCGLADYLRFFAGDEHTDAVLAYVEGAADGSALTAAARELAEAGKQLVVCVVGRSAVAQRGVAAHSGKLAGSVRVAEAALRQAGAAVVTDLDELLAAGEVLGAGHRIGGRRLHVVTNSGGEGNLIADLADGAGLDLPAMSEPAVRGLRARWPRFHIANPLDPWGVDDHAAVYPEAIAAAAAEPGDVLVVSIDQQTTCGDHEKQLGRDLAGYLADAVRGGAKTPVFLSPTSQDPDPGLAELCRAERIPLLRGARPALHALAALADAGAPAALVQHGARQRHRRSQELDHPQRLAEDDALEALAGYGLRVPRTVRAATPDDAVEAAASFAGAVAVKGVADGLWHKSEVGLVRVGAATPDEVRDAAKQVLETGRTAGLDVALLVAEMVRGRLEVIVGYHRDPQFGPVTLVGIGGVWTEFLDDVAVHVGPLDEPAAAALLDRSPVGRMLDTARGGALHRRDVLDAVLAVNALGLDHPDVVSIDVNPLIVDRDRAVAVDAVIQRDTDIGR